jgi:anti-anti-sigma factor
MEEAMQAMMYRDGEVVVVQLNGRLDVESSEPFRQACLGYLVDKKVVFNFQGLGFVGSSGILPFLETMQKLAQTTEAGFKFCNVGSEFRKVLAASPLGAIEIYDDEVQARTAFHDPTLATCVVQAAPLNNNNEGYGLLSLKAEAGEAGETVADDDDESSQSGHVSDN